MKTTFDNFEKFLIFLNLIKDELNGTLTLGDVDFDSLYSIIKEQGMQTLLFPVLKKYKANGQLKAAEAEFSKYELSVTQSVFKYAQKQFFINEVIKTLEKENIECVILKGDTLSHIYPHGDMRMSGDTDILINPKCEKKCLRLFEKMGCYVKKRTKTNNQSVCVHPKAGNFEIHVSMDTAEVSEIWYDNIELVKEPFREVKVADMFLYKTLSYTDTALNLVLHVVKHFVSGISHMRMITDTVLFMDRYHDKIDFERLENILSHLKYNTLYESLRYIGNVYLGLRNINYSDEYKQKAESMLYDIFECGEFGFDILEGHTYTYSQYSKNRFETFGKGSYKAYKRKILINDTFDLIFKNKYEMMKLYPCLEKNIKLLPFMYVHRFFTCIFKGLTGKAGKTTNTNSEEIEFFNKRMETLKEMKMM